MAEGWLRKRKTELNPGARSSTGTNYVDRYVMLSRDGQLTFHMWKPASSDNSNPKLPGPGVVVDDSKEPLPPKPKIALNLDVPVLQTGYSSGNLSPQSGPRRVHTEGNEHHTSPGRASPASLPRSNTLYASPGRQGPAIPRGHSQFVAPSIQVPSSSGEGPSSLGTDHLQVFCLSGCGFKLGVSGLSIPTFVAVPQ